MNKKLCPKPIKITYKQIEADSETELRLDRAFDILFTELLKNQKQINGVVDKGIFQEV